MEKIDIRKHARDPKYYNRDRDIETALVWNAVKKTLENSAREALFKTIKSIKISERTILITTEKPLKIMNPASDNIQKISFR